MNRSTRRVIQFIFRLTTDKAVFLFWLFIRFLSAILPLITIYLFSEVVKLLEEKSPLNSVIIALVVIFFVRIIDNYLRLKSVTKLEEVISNIGFDIHNFFLSDIKAESKDDRHAIVQAIRNFADASTMTLNLIKQPGVDSIVSLLLIPVIVFFVDFKVFIITIASIIVYYFIDVFTTQKYAHLKDILNTKTETYYAKLQDSNDFDLEQKSWCRHFSRVTHWGFTEWFTLQNAAVFFYSLTLLYLIIEVTNGTKLLSDLVLLMGYSTQTQVLLNSLSQIKDSLADMEVGLQHLAKNESVATIDLDDLI